MNAKWLLFGFLSIVTIYAVASNAEEFLPQDSNPSLVAETEQAQAEMASEIKEPELAPPSNQNDTATFHAVPFKQTFFLFSNANLRTEPSTSSTVAMVLNTETEVVAFEKATIQGKVWYHVQVEKPKASGWLSSKVVAVQKADVSESEKTTSMSHSSYPKQDIQGYSVSLVNGILTVTGKPTPYGKQNQALGIVVDIYEARADKTHHELIPFKNGAVSYSYKVTYPFGEVVANLDEYYEGVEDDPAKVLGYALFNMKDGNPYLLPSKVVESDNPAIVELAKKLTVGKKTESEKSKAIFEWVAKNVKYDTPAFFKGEDSWGLYSASQTLSTRTALCTGYANLNASLHRAIGIQAKVIEGEKHAWNEVKLNGHWQTQDPTFGAGYVDTASKKFIFHYNGEYFTKTDRKKEGEAKW